MATGVRVREDEYELKCDYCLEWWPIGDECWDKKHGWRQCRACIRERVARRIAERREDPEVRARDRAASKANREAKMAADPDYLRRTQREWYRRNAESQRAKRRERYAAEKAAEGKTVRPPGPPIDLALQRQRASNREYMRRKRAAA